MAITLRQLEIFLAVAETGHVTAASRRVFLTQSAVSMAISELENLLNGPLFDRHGKRLVLNDRGRLLLPYAREIVSKIKSIEALLSEREGVVAGELQVGASSTIGNYVLPYVISAFTKQYPQAHINMIVANSRQIEQAVEESNIDLGFIEGLVHSDKVESIPWLTDKLSIVCSPDYPLAQKQEIQRQDLEKAPWIMREEGSGTAEIFKSQISKYLDRIHITMELGHTEAIKRAVEAGMGLSCLSTLTISRELEQGWLREITVPGLEITRQLLIILRKDKIRTRLLEKFINFCELIRTYYASGEVSLNSPSDLADLLDRELLKERAA